MFRPGHKFGHYRIDAVLGEGGMGIVYQAEDLERGLTIALKVVNPDLAIDYDGNGGIEAARRLVREGRSAASLRHPNAIAVLDAGEIDGTPYIAMELARGRALGQFIGDKRVPIDQRVEWLDGMARGLAAAHTKGIVHRDVKPENVMVCDDGWVKLFDFGVAKPFADPRAPMEATVVTHTGIVIGTPLYMAPEQVLGEKLDPRSDQFAWGTVAYELLSDGIHPIATTADSHLPVPFAILKGTPKHLKSVAPNVPTKIADVVMRAMSKDPKDRFSHMDRIVDALDAYIADKAAVADSSGPHAGARSIRTPWSHTEVTVALDRPARPALIHDGDEVRETVTRQFRRDDAIAPASSRARARADAPERESPSPVPAQTQTQMSGSPESRRRAGGAAFSRPLPSAPRSPTENRADPSVLGPPSMPAPVRVEPGPPSRPLESPISLSAPRQVPTKFARALSFLPIRRNQEWTRRLLWIPILLVAALAGYGSYVLLAAR